MDFLPDELLISILEYSSYTDLKENLPLVCKRFNAILQKKDPLNSATIIDKILRRDSPRNPPLPGKITNVTLHPCLTEFVYRYSPDIDDVEIEYEYSEDKFEMRKLLHAPYRNENVSTPAAARASVTTEADGGGWDTPVEIEGTGEGGAVTVLDVMNGVVRAVREEIWWKDIVGCLWDGLNGPVEIVDGVLYLKDVWS